jgi:hypothetical protein
MLTGIDKPLNFLGAPRQGVINDDAKVFLKHPSPLLDHLGVLIGFPEEVGFGDLRKL